MTVSPDSFTQMVLNRTMGLSFLISVIVTVAVTV